MRWLLFLSRLAFICGFCFLLSLTFLFRKEENNEVVSSTIIMIGFVIGLIVLPFTLLCYLGLLIARKKLPVPIWLVVSNIVFMFILMIYLLFINVEGNHTP
jgi:hypothetical protein